MAGGLVMWMLAGAGLSTGCWWGRLIIECFTSVIRALIIGTRAHSGRFNYSCGLLPRGGDFNPVCRNASA